MVVLVPRLLAWVFSFDSTTLCFRYTLGALEQCVNFDFLLFVVHLLFVWSLLEGCFSVSERLVSDYRMFSFVCSEPWRYLVTRTFCVALT